MSVLMLFVMFLTVDASAVEQSRLMRLEPDGHGFGSQAPADSHAAFAAVHATGQGKKVGGSGGSGDDSSSVPIFETSHPCYGTPTLQPGSCQTTVDATASCANILAIQLQGVSQQVCSEECQKDEACTAFQVDTMNNTAGYSVEIALAPVRILDKHATYARRDSLVV
eukprot:CAMPEP_0169131940 /NCGR_PEP_ID=MMETSP1015-20121227/38524_1 /TAXON_ID=342587 /ORGANISM="Karlodinium micrum, Strain CCMP2283" /LENGTH=166 /DNA_ID=CAMNT_0009196253 /DNA_START=110 /DNA_END=611 /DNA_ORIENTATION=-